MHDAAYGMSSVCNKITSLKAGFENVMQFHYLKLLSVMPTHANRQSEVFHGWVVRHLAHSLDALQRSSLGI